MDEFEWQTHGDFLFLVNEKDLAIARIEKRSNSLYLVTTFTKYGDEFAILFSEVSAKEYVYNKLGVWRQY